MRKHVIMLTCTVVLIVGTFAATLLSDGGACGTRSTTAMLRTRHVVLVDPAPTRVFVSRFVSGGGQPGMFSDGYAYRVPICRASNNA